MFYNEQSFFLAIDELDSGIFEYLLGEILDVLGSRKGQLLFTAHSLRPMEILPRNTIYLTTTDPLERYIKYNFISASNNPRDKYLKHILMNDYKKGLYTTRKSELNYALKKDF